MPALPRRAAFCLALLLVCASSGCRTSTPVWSPDGGAVAYEAQGNDAFRAVYAIQGVAFGGKRLVEHRAGSPQWTLEGPTLWYLALERASGRFTAVKQWTPAREPNPPEKSVLADAGAAWTSLRMATDQSLGVLISGGAHPFQPVEKIELWRPKDNSRETLNVQESYAPALHPSGEELLVTRFGGGKNEVLLVDLLAKPPQLRALFPRTEQGTGNLPLQAVFMLNENAILVWAPAIRKIWRVPRGGKPDEIAWPDQVSQIFQATMDENANEVLFSVILDRPPGEPRYGVYAYKWKTRAWEAWPLQSPEPLHGLARDPAAFDQDRRYAWLGPAGLHLGTVRTAQAYPTTPSESAAAAAGYLAQNEPRKALDVIQAALEPVTGRPPEELKNLEWRAWLAAEEIQRGVETLERHYLLYPVRTQGLAWAQPGSQGQVLDEARIATDLANLKEGLRAHDENQLLPKLIEGIEARLRGDYLKALEAYKQAELFCPSDEMLAGAKFLEGLAAVEARQWRAAGVFFQHAARVATFPDADVAGLLSAYAYQRANQPDRANAALRALLATDSPLKEDASAWLQRLASAPDERVENLPKITSPDRRYAAWLSQGQHTLPQCHIVADPAGSTKRLDRQEIHLHRVHWAPPNRPTEVLLESPTRLDGLQFSPDGLLLVVKVEGALFPLEEPQWVDLALFNASNGQRLSLGPVLRDQRAVIHDATWNGQGSLELSGRQVGLLGAQKPWKYTYTPPRAPAAKPPR